MLSFIVAPSGYGKTHTIINEICEVLDRNEGKRIFVIVPEQESVKMEAELLTVCGNRINANEFPSLLVYTLCLKFLLIMVLEESCSLGSGPDCCLE